MPINYNFKKMSKPYIINDANGNPINAKYPPNRGNMGIYMKATRHGPRRSYSIDFGCYATMFALLIKIKNISC